jgi:hypothetical protein
MRDTPHIGQDLKKSGQTGEQFLKREKIHFEIEREVETEMCLITVNQRCPASSSYILMMKYPNLNLHP